MTRGRSLYIVPAILALGLGSQALSAADVASATSPGGDAAALSGKPVNKYWTFTAMHENDLFANTDCDYTSGVKLSWVSPDLNDYRDAGIVPEFVYHISDYLPFIHDAAIQRNVAINIGQNMYTPEDTKAVNPDPLDRPYCGWLYLGIGFHNKTERWLDIIELNMGVVGPASLARQCQKFIHEHIVGDYVNGWDHQIGNEPAVNLVWERKIRFLRAGDEFGPATDAFVHLGGSLGTLYTYANTGLTARVGWNLPKDFGTTTIRIAGDVNDPAASDDPRIREKSRWGVYVFGDLDARAVLRDGTLDGNLFSDSISVDKLPFVMDASFGVSVVAGSWKLSYAQVARSKEFHTQPEEWHVFGSISVSYTY